MQDEVKNELTVINEMDSTKNMFTRAEFMIQNNLVPSGIKKPEDIVVIVNKGEQLGMDPLTSLNSMHLIQGNVALKSSVVPGLLAKAGIATELLKDFEPVMIKKPAFLINPETNKPYPADENGNFKYYKDPDGNVAYKETQLQVNGIPEYVTTIRFHRYYESLKKTVTSDFSFYWSDAVKAKWTGKDNWKKLPRFMMFARCVMRGARGIASDVIGGLYDTHEVIEFTKSEFVIDENNDAIPIPVK